MENRRLKMEEDEWKIENEKWKNADGRRLPRRTPAAESELLVRPRAGRMILTMTTLD
jgi:hypothetical protein